MISRLRNTCLLTIFPYLITINTLRRIKIRYMNDAFIVCIGILVNSIASPIILISLLISLIYKKIIHLILQLYKGDNFKGIISGIDCAVHEYPELKRNVCFVYIFESDKTEEDFLDSLRTHIQAKLFLKELPEKLYCRRRAFMGYYYNEIADTVDVKDIVKKVSLELEISSKDEFLEELNKCIYKKLPLNNSFNWDLQCGSFKELSAKKHFILIRIQHSVCDIIAMYNILTNMLCKENINKDIYAEKFSNDNNTKFSSKNLDVRYFPVFLRPTKDFMYDNRHPHQGFLSYIEDIDGKYFRKVKAIKKNLDGSTVTLILMSSYMNSLKKMILRKNLKMKQFKSLVLSPYQKSQKRISKYYKNENIRDVNNDFFIMGFHVEGELQESVNNTLINLQKDMEKSFQSADKELIHIVHNTILNYYPNFVLKRVVSTSSPVLIGVAPGGPKLILFNGDDVKNVLVTLPKYEEYGCLLYFYSYDGKLTLTINANENVFTREELNCMLEDTFENINVLYEAYVPQESFE